MNVQESNGKTYSSWASLATGTTVEDEKKEKAEELTAQINNTWGSTSNTTSLVDMLRTAGKNQAPVKRTILVGAQASKKDRWDKLVGLYLNGIRTGEFKAFPYHNDSYKKQGIRAEETKEKEENEVIRSASERKGMTWGDFQQVGYEAESVGEKYVKKIDNKDNHYLPVKEIFENYSQVQLVKANYDENFSYYIPCKVTKGFPRSTAELGVLEVTLNKDTGKPHHVFFRTIWPGNSMTGFLQRKYPGNGAKLSQMLQSLDRGQSDGLGISNFESKVQLLKV